MNGVALERLVRVARADAGGRITITGRKIYILPTRQGLLFGVLLLIMLVASINYASNPAFLLTFLLAGLFFQAIFHTWRNLAGIELRWLGGDPCFAGEVCRIRLRVRTAGRPRFAIQLGFRGEKPVLLDLPADSEKEVGLPWHAVRRGLHRPGRLVVESRYPLGLLRAWSYLEPAGEVLVWPRPLAHRPQADRVDWSGTPDGDRGVGSDDFTGHRPYHPGDPPARLHWKAMAAGKGLLVKQFGGDRVELGWLDFEQLPPHDTETRLSLLAGAVESLAPGPLRFGLRLPGSEIPPGAGMIHRRRCLDALALFGQPEEKSRHG